MVHCVPEQCSLLESWKNKTAHKTLVDEEDTDQCINKYHKWDKHGERGDLGFRGQQQVERDSAGEVGRLLWKN